MWMLVICCLIKLLRRKGMKMIDAGFYGELQDSLKAINALSEGIDPFSGEVISGDTILNDAMMIRFFYRLHGQFNKVIDIASKQQKGRARAQADYIISPEQIAQIQVRERDCFMKEIAVQIDCQAEDVNGRKFQTRWISEWLVACGAMEVRTDDSGKNRKYATETGRKIGFRTEIRSSSYGDYTVTLLNPEGQRFIIENIDGIISGTPISL